MDDVRIGVIGNGLRGPLARLAHRPGEGAAVVAVADLHEDNLARARQWYGDGVLTTTRYQDLLEGAATDAVFVLSPDHLHEEHACAALSAWRAVFLEKPMAISVESADRVLSTAASTGSLLYVGHNMRHFDYLVVMKSMIDRGDIGEVKAVWCRHFVGHGGDFYFRDWHADRRYANTLLLQKGAHDIDVIHWLAGGYSRAVQAFGQSAVYAHSTNRRQGPPKPPPAWTEEDLVRHWPPRSLPGVNPVVDVEDISLVQMELDNGVLATYDQCHFTPDYWRNYTVIGDSGRLENFGNGEPGTCVRLWDRRCGYEPEGHVKVVPPTGRGSHGGADQRCVDEFLSLVSSGGTTASVNSPIAARQAVATACAASSSLRAGGGVRTVEPVAPELDAALAAYGRRRPEA